ncbi:unnamed protein product [Urochloa humidicola]
MGRREMSGRLSAEYQGLEVKVPNLFRCPISLDVMRSPVSLCTGVTYERASIQRWLDSGNTTCPATMLPLPSTDLVPNLTLHRLIALWASTAAPASPSSSSSSPPAPSAVGPTPAAAAAELLRRVAAPGADPCTPLRKLAAFLSDDDVDEFDKNAFARAAGAAETVASVLRRAAKEGEEDADDGKCLDAAEAAVRVLAAIAASDCIEEDNKRRVAAALAADAPSAAASLARVMRRAALEARADAARLAETMLLRCGAAGRSAVAECEPLLAELVRLVGAANEKGALDRSAVAAGLSCLAAVAATRRARAEMVRLGAVPAAVRVLVDDAGCPVKAMRVLEAAVGCAEGRAAICEAAETAVPVVVSRMMKGGTGGAEAAVSVLWAVCHRYRDRRAVAAAAACEGGLARLLLLMQSGCSPAARQMASDLLKIFRVSGKSCLAGYDSKTSHIMPF